MLPFQIAVTRAFAPGSLLRPVCCMLAALVFMAGFPAPASAITVNIKGTGGIDGLPGTLLANPDGGDGTDGASASATATGTDPDNRAFVGGGAGGNGGAAATGGIGGNGGAGGDAYATATSSTSDGTGSATASAGGGAGGNGGGVLPGQTATGGNGGNGGDASASATGTNASVSVTARGGNGGSAVTSGNGGDGGSATIGTVTSVSTTGGAASATANVRGGDGGNGYGAGYAGGNGGSVSLVNAVDADTTGSLSLEQVAQGGNAGYAYNGAAYGLAGNAHSELRKTHSAAQLFVTTRAFGGYSGAGPAFHGDATAIAEAVNLTGSADATAQAGGGGWTGNAISSATAITYADGQRARAITDSFGFGVMSQSTAIAYGNSEVFVFDRVSGTSATSSAYGESAGNQRVDVSATATTSAIGGQTNATARGVSHGGGFVRVFAEQNGQNQATDTTMTDAVSGSTTGGLQLEQLARGSGRTISSLTATNPGGGVLNGISRAEGGDSTASIDLSGVSDVIAQAISKPGVMSTMPLGTVFGRSTGGGSVAVTGEVYLSATLSSGRGGDVSITNAVDGDTQGALALEQVAYAALARSVTDANLVNEAGGDAWNQLSRTKSVADLAVTTRSKGGNGGARWVPTGVAGDGGSGNATSFANNLSGTARAYATAQGGSQGGAFYGSARGNGGDANAVAEAHGSALVGATSTAIGGTGAIQGGAVAAAQASSDGGTAISTATASGSHGSASAVADVYTAGVKTVSASTHASLPASNGTGLFPVLSSSRASISENLLHPGLLGDGQATAYGVALPQTSEVVSLLGATPGVAQYFDPAGSSDLFGYTVLGGRNLPVVLSGTPQTMSSSVGFSLDMSQVAVQQDFIVGLLGNPLLDFTGFDSIDFSILLEGNAVYDVTFTDYALALDFFSDTTLNLGDWATGLSSDGYLDVVFALDVTTATPGEAVVFDLIFGNSLMGSGVQVVPLPASLWMFLSGFSALCAVSRKTMRRKNDIMI